MKGDAAVHGCALGTPGSADILRMLVDAGADVKVSNKKGQTPLHLAVRLCPWSCLTDSLRLRA